MAGQLIYLAASLAGVGALVGLCVLLFGRGISPIDAGTVETRLREDTPGFRGRNFAASADGHAALIEDARDGAIYLVVARGSGLVTRKLSKGFLRKAHRKGELLDLHFADFTFPKARLAFDGEAAASNWEARLSHAL